MVVAESSIRSDKDTIARLKELSPGGNVSGFLRQIAGSGEYNIRLESIISNEIDRLEKKIDDEWFKLAGDMFLELGAIRKDMDELREALMFALCTNAIVLDCLEKKFEMPGLRSQVLAQAKEAAEEMHDEWEDKYYTQRANR